jgi:predicted porin
MIQNKFIKSSIGLLCLSGVFSSAMAEVKISGTVDQSAERFVTKTNPGALTGTDNVVRRASTLANYNSFSLAGNEDLGNGMKATYELSLKYVGPDTDSRAPINYLSHVGLEGGFGKLKVGRQWRPLFTSVAAIDPTQLAATPGFAGAGKSGTGLSGLAPEPNSNSITYNLPSLMPGLFAQVQKGFADATQGENAGGFVILTDGQNFFATYAKHTEKMIAGNYFAASATGTNGISTAKIPGTGATLAQLTVAGMNGLNHILFGGSTYAGGDTRESDGLAGYYNFGSFKLVGGVVSEKVNGSQAKLNMDVIGVKVPLGTQANLGYLHSKAAHTRAAGTTFNISGDKVLLSYDLSKRTTTYMAWGKQRLDGKTTAGNELSSAITALGLKHNF